MNQHHLEWWWRPYCGRGDSSSDGGCGDGDRADGGRADGGRGDDDRVDGDHGDGGSDDGGSWRLSLIFFSELLLLPPVLLVWCGITK